MGTTVVTEVYSDSCVNLTANYESVGILLA